MNNITQNKNALITIGIIIVLIIVGVLVTTLGKSGSGGSGSKDDSILPEVEAIPTVDASVIVELVADKLLQEATLTVTNFPKGTEEIEYAISYDALIEGEAVPRGVTGSMKVDPKKNTISKTITLGTCSSGACKYDKVTGKLNVELKFEGDYGAKLYLGDFEL